MFTYARKPSETTPQTALKARNQAPPCRMRTPVGFSWLTPQSNWETTPTDPIQAKLTVSQPGDALEREADHVADQVMRAPGSAVSANTVVHAGSSAQPNQRESLQRMDDKTEEEFEAPIQRTCDSCLQSIGEDERETIQRETDGVPDSFRRNLAAARKEGGTPLPRASREFMEPRFGVDFGNVRVHANSRATFLARALSARAFTVGRDVFFKQDEFRPGSATGQRLLAHELTHVVQQSSQGGGRGAVAATIQRRAESVPQEAGVQPESQAQPRLHVRGQVLGTLLEEWRQAGLLEPPFRPADVAEFPPIAAPRAGTEAAGAAAAGVATAARPAVPLNTPAPRVGRPPLRLVPPPSVAPKPVPSTVGGLAAPLAGLAVFLTILLSPSETAPPWMDELSPITRGPYGSREEYEWTRSLSAAQLDYLVLLMRARERQPDPAVDGEGDPSARPALDPAEEREREQGCHASNVSRRGGHAGHDAYATRVTGSLYDYYVRTPIGLAINYDGLGLGTRTVWEVKVGYGWFFNPDFIALTRATLLTWDAQRTLGRTVATACDYIHLWALRDRSLVRLLNARWGGAGVLHIP